MKIIHGRTTQPTKIAQGTFTGTVWNDSILPATDDVLINVITFTPGARTYWHKHPGGQILRVENGLGFVCSEGSDPVVIKAGDTVWVPAGEVHWHGATNNTILCHTATSFGTTLWQDEVAQETYDAAHIQLENIT
jgi:quercetin dioxygenase-like cupin family protein